MRQNPILLRSDDEALRYGTMVADAYLDAPSFDESQAWRWKLLIDHVERLFERIQRRKQGVKVVYVEGQPYADERELQRGVEETGILYVSTDFNTHPIFTPEQNLKFRAVHDYMTHIARDVTFGLRGEIAAYNTHAKMVPPDAVPALFTEVLGQASTFITKGFFPEQKIAALPFDYYNGIEMNSSRRQNGDTMRKPSKVMLVALEKRLTKRGRRRANPPLSEHMAHDDLHEIADKVETAFRKAMTTHKQNPRAKVKPLTEAEREDLPRANNFWMDFELENGAKWLPAALVDAEWPASPDDPELAREVLNLLYTRAPGDY